MLFLLVGFSAGYAQSPPTLDGLIDPVYISHGYTRDYDGFFSSAKGKLYVVDNPAVDPNYIWLCWEIDTDFNDNSYGANQHSTWTSGHSFFDLHESDKQRLDIENSCGEIVLDVTMDILDGPGYATPSGYDAVYNPGSEDSFRTFINGGDWSQISFDTSLAANLNDNGYCVAGDCSVGGTDLYTSSPPWADEAGYVAAPPYDNWQYNLTWELRVDRNVFITASCPAGGVLGLATNPVELHASPSKEGVSPVTLFKAGSLIGDYVWLDANRDGVQDVTERGIANVTVALYSDPNGDGDPADGSLLDTTITDLYGYYIFQQLGNANYVVQVTDTYNVLTGFALTAGSTNPHQSIDLGRNAAYLKADFGYAPADVTKAVIGNYVWSDYDNDGIQEAGEPGIGGVTLQLMTDIDGDGLFTDFVATTTTADDGFYLFANLDPGNYQVDVTDSGGILTGFSLSIGSQSSTDPTETIRVDAGTVYLNADFGYYSAGLGTIGNQVWFEADGNGTYSPGVDEHGLNDVTLDLIRDSNGNGVWDAGERVIASLKSPNGTYQFRGLLLDDGGGDGDFDYLVMVKDDLGKLLRYRKSDGPNPGADNNSQVVPYPVALSAAQPTNMTADFGYWFDQTEGLVGDLVWYDLNGNGLHDAGEVGVGGVELEMWSVKKQGGDDVLLARIMTDRNGIYYLPNLGLSRQGAIYRIKVAASNFVSGPLVGYELTTQGSPAPVAPHLRDSIGLTETNSADLTLDFGYSKTGGAWSIGDYVWHDGNGDSVQDAGESGFEGVTLALYQDNNGDGIIDDGEPVIATDTTDVNGNYLFVGLTDGNYIVQVTDESGILSGYYKTYGNQPSAVFINGNNDLTIDYGYFRPSPTLAVIAPFEVYNDGGRVVVHWETYSEVGTAGFNLFRRNADSGKFVALNREFLPGLLNAPQGGVYRFVDPTAETGRTYTYKIEEVEFDGTVRDHGPFTRLVQSGPPQPEPDHHGHLPPLLKPMWSASGKDSGYVKEAHPLPRDNSTRRMARMQDLHTARVLKTARVGDEVRIVVREEGLYYLDAATIGNALGMTAKQAQQKISGYHFRLSCGGLDTAYLAAAGGMGIYFYGVEIDSPYTADNVYWLQKGKGTAMGTVDGGSPTPGTDDESFTDLLEIEANRFALTALFNDPAADYWLWDYVIGGRAGKSFGFSVPAPAGYGSATLTVYLKGATNTVADRDHHARISLNGTIVGSGRWDGTAAHELRLPIDPALLNDGANTIEVSGLLSGGVPYSIFYVDSFHLEYRRLYRAEENRLLCRGDGNRVVTINGFNAGDVMVFDVTNPRFPRLVTNTVVGGDGVSFNAALAGNRYVAANSAGMRTPVWVSGNSTSSLKHGNNSADYLVIVPEGLGDAAAKLVELRRSGGLGAMAVELQDIYNEFNHGIADPRAIRAFLSYAVHNWRGSVPRYVVLAGEGTYDYKDYLGHGENLVPPFMIATPNGLFASDNYYGDVTGDDGIPEIAVGRLPVMSAAELGVLVDKLTAHEYSGGDWTDRVMLVADNPDNGGDFTGTADTVAAMIPLAYDVEKIYLPDFASTSEARQALLRGFNRGALLMAYIGHATLAHLANERILTAGDVPGLTNDGSLPVVTAMTCVIGRFELAGYDTLGERLLLKERGGAAAVWAPTGASVNWLANQLAEAFYKVVFKGRAERLGDALLAAMQNYAATGNDPFMIGIYTLLGDPAMVIK